MGSFGFSRQDPRGLYSPNQTSLGKSLLEVEIVNLVIFSFHALFFAQQPHLSWCRTVLLHLAYSASIQKAPFNLRP